MAAELTPGEATGLEGTNVPDPNEEDVRVPLPATPPAATGPGAEPAATPPAVEPGGAAVPFEPTPAIPPAGGIGLPAAPLPATPLPGGAAPLPGAVVPPDAAEPNPFDGSRAPGEGGLRLNDDPPPTLPASLRSSRRARDAKRAAEDASGRPSESSGLTRLPRPTGQPQETGRYQVQQASATVWASGTNDIRPVDPNAGRVQQAIHHEPVK
jgi:hypothetical protein